MEMRAAFCTGPRAFEVRTVPRPEPGPGEALVRVRNCGICGSDLHFYHGRFPQPPAVCPGHEIAGVVEAVGEGVDAALAGRAVAVEPLRVCGACAYCLSGAYQLCGSRQLLGMAAPGGFAEYLSIPARHLFPLPGGVDFATAALAEPLAVAVHGVRLAGVGMGDRVAVLGAGTIGLMSVVAAQAAGAAEVVVTARHAHQSEAALALGAARAIAADAQATQRLTTGAPIDVVFETVGGETDTLGQALTVVRPGGTVCVLGVFTQASPFNPTMLLLKEARMVGGITYGRPDAYADFDIAVDIIGRRRAELGALVTHRVPLADIAGGFAAAADKATGSIKVSIEA